MARGKIHYTREGSTMAAVCGLLNVPPVGLTFLPTRTTCRACKRIALRLSAAPAITSRSAEGEGP